MLVEKENWHLSKSVPISLIAALVLQTGVFVWTIATMANEIQHNKEDIVSLKTMASVATLERRSSEVKLGGITEKLEYMSKILDRIDRNLNDATK